MKNTRLFTGIFSIFLWANSISAQGLDDYLKIASENNPEVKAAYSRFEAAMQKAPQVAALPDPTLNLSAFGRMVETRLGGQEARFTLMQMFPWFGTLDLKENTANLMAQAKFQQFLETRESLFVEVKNAYAEIYKIEKTIQVMEDDLAILESYRKLALNRFEAGNSPMVNVVKVDIKREEVITQIELMKEELISLQRQFNLLLNREKNAAVKVKDSIHLNMTLLEHPDFNAHPRVSMLENERQAYETEVQVARKEALPMLGLGVDYVVISERMDANPVDNGQDAIMPMFSVSLPIFQKKYKAAREEARLMAEATEQQKQSVLNQMKSEAEMLSFQLRKAERLLDLYERQIESSNQASKLLISGFSSANADFEEVLQINQDLLMLKIQKIDALVNGFKAAAKLDFLLFKNFSDENE